ncbi:hypothetical protein [Angelakisella massiliensis]|uniref:hypothetical protein n=1 Tax=Angelakisella massiliensis TaxID=1871018 RepID=UPI0011142F33|nr:hypothetical protein [Angelakisella massiliensis]
MGKVQRRIFWEELSITYRAAIAAKLRMILFIQKRDGRVFGRLFFAVKISVLHGGRCWAAKVGIER